MYIDHNEHVIEAKFDNQKAIELNSNVLLEEQFDHKFLIIPKQTLRILYI